MSNNKITGNKGEEIAADFIKKLGYIILKRNYRIRGGEIDIVAKDKDELVFVEVKTRFSHNFGLPVESINYYKLKALLKTALFFIQEIKWGDKPYRVDVVSVDFADSLKEPKIELIKNITS